MIWRKFGPFSWDLMAQTSNVNRDDKGKPLRFFSRYFDINSEGVNIFAQDISKLKNLFCFPPFPIISMVLKFLQAQEASCVVLIPNINAPWINRLRTYAVTSLKVARAFDRGAFTITHATGKIVPKIYEHDMIAVHLQFKK